MTSPNRLTGYQLSATSPINYVPVVITADACHPIAKYLHLEHRMFRLADISRILEHIHETGSTSYAKSASIPKFTPTKLAAARRKAKFDQLVAEWNEDIKYLSSSDALIDHPAYQQIIGMGRPVLPLIFRNLEETGGHWFWALREITGEDPVKPEEWGNIAAMTARWLAWWKSHKPLKPRKRINARTRSF